MSWLKSGAAVLTAVVVVIGGLAVTAYFVYAGTVSPDVGMPIIAGGIVGGTGFLWAKAQAQANQDAAAEASRTAVATLMTQPPANTGNGAQQPPSAATGDDGPPPPPDERG